MVSIIIPNYNKSAFVRRALDSVLAQTSPDWEAICVDDGSTDGSIEILQEYAAKDGRINVIILPENRGGNYARNRGAAESKGEYLIFLDSDDWLASDCVEGRVAEFSKPDNASYDMLVFPMQRMGNGHPAGISRYCDPRDALLGFLRHTLPWQTMMPIWRREAFERIGGFNEEFRGLQDVELYARALLKGLRYGLAKRETPDCLYNADESRHDVDFAKRYSTSVKVTNLFLAEMQELIKNSEGERQGRFPYGRKLLLSALNETRLSAIRNFCDACQAGRIDSESRDDLCGQIISASRGTLLLRFYVFCYRCRVNRLHGFLYRRVMRVFG